MKYITLLLASLIGVTAASAHGLRHRGGHFICGATQARYFGLTDPRFNLALNWAALLPHTDAHPGAVVVQRRAGHALDPAATCRGSYR
jgi:hypothetical protein